MTPTQAINEYLEASATMSSVLLSLNSDVEDYNLMLSDLDHFVELEDLTVLNTENISNHRKFVLVERRRAKDFVRVIDQILPKQIEGRTTRDRYEFAIRNLGDRVYTPRKITLDEAKIAR